MIDAGLVLARMVEELRVSREQLTPFIDASVQGIAASVQGAQSAVAAAVAGAQVLERLTEQARQTRGGKVPLLAFHGDGDVNAWIQRAELEFDAANVTDDVRRGMHARCALFGLASQHIEAHGVQGWTDLKVVLRERFIPRNQEFYLREKLFALKQTGSLDTYLLQFNELLGRLSRSPAEEDKLLYFVSGLRDATKQAVLYRSPDTLKAAMDCALAFENAHCGSTTNSQSQRSSVSNSAVPVPMELDAIHEDYTGTSINAIGTVGTRHRSRSRVHFQESPARGRGRDGLARGRSWRGYSGGANTKSPSQYGPNSNFRRFQSPSQPRSNVPFKGIRCYNCQQTGHLARDCPQNVQSSQGFFQAPRGGRS